LSSSTTTARRFKIYDVLIGTNGTPADNFIEWDISRITASSTTTVLAATALDSADAAAFTVATVNSSTFARSRLALTSSILVLTSALPIAG